ncbi:MAG TPA: hypothetical protein VIM16_04165 [Mucilaginibacter sp.]|jgi:hypothetical protein
MNRTVKILLALCCLVIGCVLTLVAQSMLLSDIEWLIPIFSVAGFIVIMVAGVYSFLEVAEPLVH